MLVPVIMAGGTGSRLWPLSQASCPKQFLRLNGPNTLLQDTLLRLEGLNTSPPVIIGNENHRMLIMEQLRQINIEPGNIILEPCGRNTAPAIALAALAAINQGDDPLLLVLAADHVIHDNESFHRAIQVATPYADAGKLVTFGIVPDKPETGYGYIERGERLSESHHEAFGVSRFIEKPDPDTAQRYLSAGIFYWNSGMFLFRASSYLEALSCYRPDILHAVKEAIQASEYNRVKPFFPVDPELFSRCPDESIDYAIMEKTPNAVVVPLDAGWSDIGSWSALWDINKKDNKGNVSSGGAYFHNSNNCYINSSLPFVAVLGLNNVIIVNNDDTLLVAERSCAQDVRRISDYLRDTDHRARSGQAQPFVQNVSVRSGDVFSFRKQDVDVYWIILSGTARITLDGETTEVSEHDSFFIPAGRYYIFDNPGETTLKIAEVRIG